MGKWTYRIPEHLASGLRDAIDNESIQLTQEYLMDIAMWMSENIPGLEDDIFLIDLIDEIQLHSPEDGYEDYEEGINYCLEHLYDICDSERIWIPL